jgi:serine/threonine protein kinase/tetratricopeptide (TPR) repeat protein
MSTPSLVEDIFLAAVEKATPEERAAYLDEACRSDAELRRRVERLLAAHPKVGDFLEQPPPEAPSPGTPGATVDSAPGLPETEDYGDPTARVGALLAGKYKLVEAIGEGGMGSVFMAQQTAPVKRAVAVKVVKAGMDSRAVLARFEAERQALAMMDHPHIAKVLDAGTTDGGRPFFVMELVKGTPITRYCDEHRLTPRQRLELFVPVCQAIQHAHQKGIIHRDLKPSNVLVALYDDRPVPKVIDFGVAKAAGQALTDKTLMTGFGALVGTPEYMSPEQASLNNLDIDTRSDVYSLGVLLYELLTGTTPVDKKSLGKAALLEILRIVREVEAPRPSAKLSTIDTLPSVAANRGTEPAKLSRLMKGELDWLVLKALEKDRTRRYETANGLARDIQRYLADEVVEARPPSVGYRLSKFVRRHKGQVIAASLVLLALVGGFVGTTLGLFEARRQEKIARDETAEREKALLAEKEAKEEAQAREGETKAVLDFVENRVFAAARPKEQAGGQGYDVKLADAIKAALPFVDTSFTAQPLIEARLRKTMGLSFWYLGDAKTAIEQEEKARALYTRHRGPDHPDTLVSMMNLANSYDNAGRIQEALKLREETLELQKAKLGSDHRDTLMSMNNLANSYEAAGRTQQALKLHEETLQLRKAKLGPDDPDTLMSMGNLAYSYNAAGPTQEGLKLGEETLPLLKAKLGPDHPHTLASMTNLAISYAHAGRTQEALKLREEALQLTKAKLGPDHLQTLRSMTNLAISYADTGRTQEALKLREETLQLQKTKLGPDHRSTLISMNNLAESYAAAGRSQEARKLYEEALQLMKAKLGPDHPDTLTSMTNLGEAYQTMGELAKALPLLEQSFQKHKAKLGAEHTQTLGTMSSLGLVLLQQTKWADAEPVLRDCLAIREKQMPDSWLTFNTQSLLGGALLGQKKYAEAEPLLVKGYEGMKTREKTIPQHGGGELRLPEALDRLMELYTAINKPDEAKKWQAERAKYPQARKPVAPEKK